MKYYQSCPEEEATHVRILDTEDNRNRAEFTNLTINSTYEIIRSTLPGFEGEEMILSDDGQYVCSFSLYIDVEWLKEDKEFNEILNDLDTGYGDMLKNLED
ncbi:hypothetical protein [Bacillus infantis]|uniref:hypothetical protein n=1 Tax=Bacillus infantis TaxID=324767 RepID=UPI003CEDBB34